MTANRSFNPSARRSDRIDPAAPSPPGVEVEQADTSLDASYVHAEDSLQHPTVRRHADAGRELGASNRNWQRDGHRHSRVQLRLLNVLCRRRHNT